MPSPVRLAKVFKIFRECACTSVSVTSTQAWSGDWLLPLWRSRLLGEEKESDPVKKADRMVSATHCRVEGEFQIYLTGVSIFSFDGNPL